MDARILKEKGDRDIATIKDLNLESCKSLNVTGLSEDWKSLESLVLTNVGLTSLKGFPRLPNLKKLELNKNNLSEGLDALACLPKLEELNLSRNCVKDLETIQPLAQVNTLKTLTLTGCDICKVENYKDQLFQLIPSLVQLDGVKKGSEKQENGVAVKNGEHKAEDEEDSDDYESGNEDGESSGDDEEDSDDENDDDIPLEALYEKINDEMDDDDDFEAEEEDDDEDIDEEDEDLSVNISQNSAEETQGVRGTKRKHDDEN